VRIMFFGFFINGCISIDFSRAALEFSAEDTPKSK